jgi:hypothetical protein
MKRDMHEIFREAFKGLGIEAVRLIVGHRNSLNTQRELVRKRPSMKLLTIKNKGNTQSIIRTTNDKSIANRIFDLKYSLRSKEIFVDIRIWMVQVQKFIIQIKV